MSQSQGIMFNTEIEGTHSAGRKVHISCFVDNHPRFRMQAWNWLLSLRALDTRCRIFIFHTSAALSPKTKEKYTQLGATLIETSSFGEGAGAYCNKIRQLETKNSNFLNADFVILSDADLVFLQDPALLAHEGLFRAKLVDAPNPPESVWSELFKRANLTEKARATPLEMIPEKRTFDLNFNGGLYVIPHPMIPSLETLWKKHATFCLKQGDLLGNYLHHSDQLGMGLALAESCFPAETLPAGANFPTHLPAALLSKIAQQPISALHYHFHVDQHGLPKETGLKWIDVSVLRIRKILTDERRKLFLNDLFWDFRYS